MTESRFKIQQTLPAAEVPSWFPVRFCLLTVGDRQFDSGRSGSDASRYVLQWETLPANNDRRRKSPLPEPSMLRLCEMSLREEPEQHLADNEKENV